MEFTVPIPFTKKTPEQILRKIDKLNIQLKGQTFNLRDAPKFYAIKTGFSIGTTVDCSKVIGQAQAYNTCPPLNAVVNRWLLAAANAVWMIVNKDNEPIKSDIQSLIDRPNPIQTTLDFLLQAAAMLKIHGQCYIYKAKGIGLRTPYNLWVIPNYLVSEKLTGKWMDQTKIEDVVSGYQIEFGGRTIPVIPEDMIKIKSPSANFFSGQVSAYTTQGNSITDGQSRLFAMSDVVNGLTAAYASKMEVIKNGGPLGVLSKVGNKESIGVIPATPEERAKFYTDFENTFGTGHGQQKYMLAREEFRWVQINKGIKDLMLFEEIESGTREVCAAMDYPFELLGYSKDSSLAGGGKFKELKLMLYTDSIIPSCEYLGKALSRELLRPGEIFKPFFDHLDIFQKSRQDDAATLKTFLDAVKIAIELGLMTDVEAKELMKNYL